MESLDVMSADIFTLIDKGRQYLDSYNVAIRLRQVWMEYPKYRRHVRYSADNLLITMVAFERSITYESFLYCQFSLQCLKLGMQGK